MGMYGPVPPKDYSDGRTKQSFKDSTDINKILAKAQVQGSLSHLMKHGAVYGDFQDVPDLLTAHQRIKAGQKIYEELPSELRREFPDMFKFFEHVAVKASTPEGLEALELELPDLARPGRQVPAVVRSAATEANPATRSAEPEAPAEAPAAAVEPPTSSTT